MVFVFAWRTCDYLPLGEQHFALLDGFLYDGESYWDKKFADNSYRDCGRAVFRAIMELYCDT